MSSSGLILGVDGGGTKTSAWLASFSSSSKRSSHEIVGRGQAGPGNPRAAGFEVACQSILNAIEGAFADSGRSMTEVDAATFCLAGAGRSEEQNRINAWAREKKIARCVQTHGDAEPILAAASSEFTGIALIAGTGSFAWGRNLEGKTARSGGWGYLIGDEGSAYQIALGGLRAAVMGADQRGPYTSLLDLFQHRLEAAQPFDLIDRIYRKEMDRVRIAELASIVFEAQRGGDPEAGRILEEAASGLVKMVQGVAQRLAFDSARYPLAMTGGVLLGQPAFCARIHSLLESSSFQPSELCLVHDPVKGAVELAARMLSESRS